MKLLFVFNPRSGKGLIREHLVDIVDVMVKAGYEVTIYTTQAQGDAIKKIKEEANRRIKKNLPNPYKNLPIDKYFA